MTKNADEKIDKIWSRAGQYSGEASKVARQLAFGEGAIFWFFLDDGKKLTLIITAGMFFLVLYFVFDIAQYLVGAWLNKNLASIYETQKEKKELIAEQIIRPRALNLPMYFCYYLKFIMLAIGSLILLGLFIAKFMSR